MDYLLTEQQIMVRDLARKIAKERIAPVAAEHDEKETFPWDIMKVLAESDLCGVYIEEKYGGLGGGITEMCLVTEELSRACGGIALGFAGTGLGGGIFRLFTTSSRRYRGDPSCPVGRIGNIR